MNLLKSLGYGLVTMLGAIIIGIIISVLIKIFLCFSISMNIATILSLLVISWIILSMVDYYDKR